jgi:hypothetical protein
MRLVMEEKTREKEVDLGEWLGRRAAARCPAADAERLRTIRSQKLYRAFGLTWEEFCKQRAGIDRSHADAIIRKLEEFGPAFFQLSGLIRISPTRFRSIAAAVTEMGLHYAGEFIPFDASAAKRLAAAVKALSSRAAVMSNDPSRRLERAECALKSALAGLESVSTQEMDLLQRQSLHATFEHAMEKLGQLACIVPHV